jgi:hypothetical protein
VAWRLGAGLLRIYVSMLAKKKPPPKRQLRGDIFFGSVLPQRQVE